MGGKVGSKADGKGKATYYIAGDALSAEPNVLSTEAVNTPPLEISTPAHDSDVKDFKTDSR